MKKDQIIKLLKTCIIATLILIFIEILFLIPQINNFFINWVNGKNGWSLFLTLWILLFLQSNIIPIPAVAILELSVHSGIEVLSWQYILLVMSAYMGGCILSYWLGRWFGSKAVKWVAGSEEDFDKWSKFINEKGKWWYLITIVLPLFPDDILCIIAGSLKMDFGFYTLANLIGRSIGLITMLVVLKYIGIASSSTPFMLIVWCVGLVAEIITLIVLNKKCKKGIK